MAAKKFERVMRTRRLTPEEVARDQEIRRKVEEEFRSRAPAGLIFRGFMSGEVAVIQNKAGRPIGMIEEGVHLVNLAELERVFGTPARRVIGASTAFTS